VDEKKQQGDTIFGKIEGNVSGQAAIGKAISQTQSIGTPTAEITPADLAMLHGLLADLKAQIEASAPAEKKEAALERVDEFKEAVTAKQPDLSTMEYVKGWFGKHLPGLAGAVLSVVVHPVVGKLVSAAGDAVAKEFQHRFGQR
jgi:hypothetical protein